MHGYIANTQRLRQADEKNKNSVHKAHPARGSYKNVQPKSKEKGRIPVISRYPRCNRVCRGIALMREDMVMMLFLFLATLLVVFVRRE